MCIALKFPSNVSIETKPYNVQREGKQKIWSKSSVHKWHQNVVIYVQMVPVRIHLCTNGIRAADLK